ncbi:MAG: EAL domain-containing protein [Rubrivivax sp.]|nr:EAL domain-containing protein [Rubrivivax sp.]
MRPNPVAVVNLPVPPVALAVDDARYEPLSWISRAVWVFDIDRRCVHWANAAALNLWNAESLIELRARDLGADMSASVAQRMLQFQQDFEAGPARFDEQWTLYPKGQPQTLRVAFSGHRLVDGRMAMLCEALDERNGDPASVRSVDALLHTPVMITLYDWQARVLYRNPAARAKHPERIDQGHRFVRDEDFRTLLSQLLARGQARLVAAVHTREGERWHEVHASRCRDAASGRQAFLVSEVDVTELKRTEARAHHLALHDTLTGLPNRHYVLREFGQTLQALGRQRVSAALIFIDLDHFKTVNDSMGHAFGDQLLLQMADRLRTVVREGDLVARLGGDEFLVLAVLHDDDGELAVLTQRILTSLSAPVTLLTTEVCVTSSIGTSLFPRDGNDIQTLMRHADMAMYGAKDQGRNAVAAFTPAMKAATEHRMSLENELRHALERGEFELFYQPKLTIDNRLVGAEALLRWRHPERGLVSPAVFVPVCEEIGLIGDIGAWVIESAARQQVRWRDQGHRLQVALNLSPRQLAGTQLLDTVRAVVASTGCDPRSLELEVTESMLLGNDLHTRRLLTQLSEMGFSIAIDDFGTGYSNLAYLQRYPIRTLKIDRSFVQAIGQSSTLTEVIVMMCKALNLHMVAEGVERADQLAWLAERGVHEYQGFLFSPPLPVAEFDQLLSVTDARRVA